MSQFGESMGADMPGGGFTFSTPQLKTPTVSYAGGDMPRGLGWAALALALGAALLPYVATALAAATARTVRLPGLGVGGFIVLYLLTQNLRFTGIGLMRTAGGCALGSRRCPARTPRRQRRRLPGRRSRLAATGGVRFSLRPS